MSEERRRVLDDLEENHPRYLAELLQNGELESVIERRAKHYSWTVAQVRQRLPSATDDQIDELVNHALFEVNPDRQDQEPLNAEEEKLFWEFKDSHGLA